MDLGYQGKSVIVTGGGSNIGRSIVLAFAGEGANITIADLDAEQGGRVVEEAKAAGAGGVQLIKTDVTDLAQVEAMVQAAKDKFGSVDVLVNNVGWDERMFFTRTTPEFWDKVIKINYYAVLNCTRAVLDVMIENQKGAIVSISSDASRQGEPQEAVYGGVKAAINSFMKTVAKENGRYNIRCNAICPGITVPNEADDVGGASMWTDIDSMFTPEQFEKIAQALPLKKIGKPEDIANAVLFFGSDTVAGNITGQVVSVSGGYSMVG
ncbi:MAG: SDR family oxidoreductase [Alphaproteobacteria bacterium]|jgi:NAD(P)-dependent dehydrogenase (short-subunit alcohol dehydrogenase family)|nr:SDR family oxidoreductase [Alphaproteobacteria bacterium]HJP20056.1 SDR family oxidoreductase [Alphaproteobacteria bacterium]